MSDFVRQILRESHDALLASSMHELSSGVPVLGRLLGTAAHELDVLTDVHDSMRAAGTHDIAVVRREMLHGINDAILLLLAEFTDIMTAGHYAEVGEEPRRLEQFGDALALVAQALSFDYVSDSLAEWIAKQKEKDIVRTHGTDGGADVPTDGADQPSH